MSHRNSQKQQKRKPPGNNHDSAVPGSTRSGKNES